MEDDSSQVNDEERCNCDTCPDDNENCDCEEERIRELYAQFYGRYEDHVPGTRNLGQWGQLPQFLGPKLWTPSWLKFELKPSQSTPITIENEGSNSISGDYNKFSENELIGAKSGVNDPDDSPALLCKCGDDCVDSQQNQQSDAISSSDVQELTETDKEIVPKSKRSETILVRDIIGNAILTPNVVIAKLDRIVPELTPTFSGLISFLQIAIKAIQVKILRYKLRSKLAAMNFSANKKFISTILNDIFVSILTHSGCCYQIYAKGEEDVRLVPTDYQGPYIVCCTPLSGNLNNLETGSECGTIFTIYKRDSKLSPFSSRTANMSYKYLVSSGYALFASNSKLVLTAGKRIYSFTLDPVVKEFVLTDENIKIPQKGAQISVDEGHSGLWEPQILEYMKRKKDPKLGKPLRTRYVGCLVADFHRILYSGGIYLYPANRKDPQGKTTLLCECVPLAHIAELAGGSSSTGKLDVLKTEADHLGQYIPFFVGSKNEMQELLLITSSPSRG